WPSSTATRPMVEEAKRRGVDRLVVGVFIASGAAGLIYQVVWSSQLVLVFGNTTEAIGTIVTAFLAGLGLGGLAGGLLAPRLRRPLRLYGAVEILVGAAALVVPVIFQLIDGVYRSAYDTTSGTQLTLVRLLLTLAAVTPVTFLMGLTLPLLTRHLVTSMHDAGSRMGLLYSANTFGAMAGTLLAGLVLIEVLGLAATTHVAVALNLVAGVTAIALASRSATNAHVARPAPVEGARNIQPAWWRPLLYGATFISGLVALALEVLWTRMLAEGTGSTIYIFVVILAVYLFGIAAGGNVYRGRSSSQRDTPRALAAAFLGVAVATVVTVPVATMWLTTSNVARALILLPATFFMGYAFPLTARLLTRTPAHGSRSIGVLYAWNTLGSILGSLAAAFLLAGTLGTNRSIFVLGAADAAVALIIVIAAAAPLVPARLTAATALGVVIPPLLVATGSPLVLTATQHRIAQSGLRTVHTEDRLSTVDAVGGPPYLRRLYASGTAMTALSVDTKLMAYIPKILRPQSSTLLDICFDMGTTFRSALQLGFQTDAVDLSPSIPNQMPMFYDDAQQYLHNPKARIITDDGRNHVKLTSRRYDAITVDPPPPIQAAGASVLYSKQFYEDAHHALLRGGLMFQWLYFGIDLDQFREHLRTFRSVFPHVMLMTSPRHGGVYMLGSDDPITLDRSNISRFLDTPQAVSDISGAPDATYLQPGSWTQLVSNMVWLQDDQVDAFAGAGPMITDDAPLTEYYILHQLFGGGPHVTEAQLRALTAS
ncbi:MAG: fused MFS/spermidine synthase, partial [Candidatus Dormibacteria bacterium]